MLHEICCHYGPSPSGPAASARQLLRTSIADLVECERNLIRRRVQSGPPAVKARASNSGARWGSVLRKRPKKVLALDRVGLPYRLIGRNGGLSKNPGMTTIKRVHTPRSALISLSPAVLLTIGHPDRQKYASPSGRRAQLTPEASKYLMPGGRRDGEGPICPGNLPCMLHAAHLPSPASFDAVLPMLAISGPAGFAPVQWPAAAIRVGTLPGPPRASRRLIEVDGCKIIGEQFTLGHVVDVATLRN